LAVSALLRGGEAAVVELEDCPRPNWVLRRSLRIVPWPREFSSSIVGAGHLVLKLNVQSIAKAPARRMRNRLQF